MSRVRAKNTTPEVSLRKELWVRGMRYRKHALLPGKPDIAFPGKRLAIFVDGCFWHACLEHGSIPKTNTKFWKQKLSRNVERDRENDAALKALGWSFIRVWEHDVKHALEEVVRDIEREWEN